VPPMNFLGPDSVAGPGSGTVGCAVCGTGAVRQWFNRMLCKQHIELANNYVRPSLPCCDGKCPRGPDTVCWDCAGEKLLSNALEFAKEMI